MAAAARTGQRVILQDDISVVASFFSSFFCISKVMLMQSACSRDGSLWLRSRPFLKNRISDAEEFGSSFFCAVGP